ncbi:rab-like protein 2A isoform X1 [Rhipicephalus microplus]|uniref:rab-like protein 2A isoform X1 n=1 Tax=Rhipicephalus microplus TaxID=6941 RepID=UPI003F6A6F0F
MAGGAVGAGGTEESLEQDADGHVKLKVICLGDSAVGKSKLVERFLLDAYKPHQASTYALTLLRHKTKVDGEPVIVDFWDTAGQERFKTLHPSYYHHADACILVFDITRKITYKNLSNWYKELREHRPAIPCLCVANKIDADGTVVQKSFNFGKKNGMPFYFVSASDGTNVVKMFRDAISAAYRYRKDPTDFIDQVLQELEGFSSEGETEDVSSTSGGSTSVKPL